MAAPKKGERILVTLAPGVMGMMRVVNLTDDESWVNGVLEVVSVNIALADMASVPVRTPGEKG